MKIYDVSMTISPSMPVYKNREAKKPKWIRSATFEQNGVEETDLSINMHTGTHVDFPRHVTSGGRTIDDFDVAAFVGDALVVDCTHVTDAILVEDLERAPVNAGDWVFLHTTSSDHETFDFNFPYLSEGAAKWLRDKFVRGVGIDALGIERGQVGHPAHHALLDEGIFIIEGLRLKDIPEGRYHFVGAPLKIQGVEASLLRALLIKE
jgi:arylformamidase